MSTLEMVLWAALGLLVGFLMIACCCLLVRPPRLHDSEFEEAAALRCDAPEAGGRT